jgi:hypothetical protein
MSSRPAFVAGEGAAPVRLVGHEIHLVRTVLGPVPRQPAMNRPALAVRREGLPQQPQPHHQFADTPEPPPRVENPASPHCL